MEKINEIYEIKRFTDKEGRKVEKLIPVEGGLIEWHGFCTLTFPEGSVPIQFKFPETTLNEMQCFETFDDNVSIAVKKLSEEANKARAEFDAQEKALEEAPAPIAPEGKTITADFTPKTGVLE